MAHGITLYDVLGVTAGASVDSLRYAYDARLRQLRPGLAAGASSPVVTAVTRAREAVEMSWLVLSDAERRLAYDKAIGLHQRGLRGSGGFAEGAFGYARDRRADDPYDLMRAAEDVLKPDLLQPLTALVHWIAPRPAPRRRALTVPDVRGLFYRPCQAAATLAGLRLEVVRLTPDPLPVEGLVIGQRPDPGTRARRQSTLTVEVWHPPRTPAG